VSNNSFNGGSYVVTQQGTGTNPSRVKIRSVATGPNGSTAQIEAWVQSDTNSYGCGGVCTGGALTISGYVDSYNSSLGAYGGSNVGHNGNIKSNGNITIQGGSIIGGGATAGGTVSNSGTVTGTITNGASSPVTMPTVSGCGPPYSSGAGISGGSYNSSTGAWTVSGGSNTGTLAPGTYCFSSVTISGGATLSVSGATTMSLTGQGTFSGGNLANTTGDPSNLVIQSSYSNASNGITVSSGGSQVAMTISCPSCKVTLSGGGDFQGAVIAGSATVSGGTHVHYDTHLGGASNSNVKMYGWVQTF
jgi:hypothetical protein